MNILMCFPWDFDAFQEFFSRRPAWNPGTNCTKRTSEARWSGFSSVLPGALLTVPGQAQANGDLLGD